MNTLNRFKIRKLAIQLCAVSLLTGATLAPLTQAATTSTEAVATANKDVSDLIGLLFPHPATTVGQSATLMPDGRWLLIGGAVENDSTQNVSSAAQWIDPKNNHAQSIHAILHTARRNHSASLMPDGSVWILGGVDENGLIASAERFNPYTQKFQNLDLSLLPRTRHAATLLTDGSLLITGGLGSRGEPLVEAEIVHANGEVERFNPRIDRARLDHLSSLLPTGAVVLLGGVDEKGIARPDAQIYDVAKQNFVATSLTQIKAQAQNLNGTQAPILAGTLPIAESRNIAIDSTFTLRFAKRMLMTSLSAQTVTLIGPAGAVKVHVTPAENGLLAFIKPLQTLLPGSTYTLFVKGATDARGELLPFTSLAYTTESLNTNASTQNVGGAVSRETAASNSTVRPEPFDKAQDRLVEGLLPSYNTAAGRSTHASRTPETAIPTNSEAARNTSRPQGERSGARVGLNDTASDEETWHPKAYNKQTRTNHGRWHYATPFAGTLREYQKYTQDRRIAEQAELLRAPNGTTAVSGRILRINGRPLAGVSLSIGNARATSDAQGRFLLSLPSSSQLAQTLTIEGSTANTSKRFYGSYQRKVDIATGQTTLLEDPIYMSPLDPQGTTELASPTNKETIVSSPDVPGLEIRIPAGTVIRDRSGQVITRINVTPIPVDRAAYPMPVQADFPVYFTLQPAGAYLQSVDGKPKIASLIYPNYNNLPAGSPVQFWAYDPQDKGWHIYGNGKVSSDAKRVELATGLGFQQFTGFSFGVFGGAGGDKGGDPGCSGGGATGGSGGNSSKSTPNVGSPSSDACADPVMISRGSFMHSQTDLAVADVMPLTLDRTFMDRDTIDRPFGIGMTHRFEMNLYAVDAIDGFGDKAHYTGRIALIQPNGVQLIFNRVLSSIPNDYNASWEHTDTQGEFYKAVLVSDYPSGLTFSLKLRDGTVYTFHAYGTNKLLAIKDRFGNQIEISREPALVGSVKKLISNNGRYIEFTYDAQNHISSATDNIGRKVTYEYQTNSLQPNYGRLLKVTAADNGIWQYTYTTTTGNVGRIESIIDPRTKRMVLNEYDANLRVKKQTNADNTFMQFTYAQNAAGQVTQTDVTDQRSNVRRVLFNSNSNIISSTYPLGKPEAQTTTFEYTNGLLTKQTDALNRATQFAYDSLGNLASTTYLFGTADAVTYSCTWGSTYSVPITCTDPLNHSVTYGYDALGRLTSVKDGNSNITTIGKDSANRITTIKSPLSIITTTLTYNGPDLVSAKDALGNIATFGYDAIGRMQTVKSPLGNLGEQDFDNADRLTQSSDPLQNKLNLKYDLNGNLLEHKDAKGQVHTYVPDDLNRTLSAKDALLKTEMFAYEVGGELKQITDRKGQISGRKVDALGRVTFIGYGATAAAPTTYTMGTRYTWDAGNRLKKIEDGTCSGIDCATFTVTASVAREYDLLDRVKQESSQQGVVYYAYDKAGRRSVMTVSGQPAITYGYDNANRLKTITQAAHAVNGNVAQVISFDYDNANRRTNTTLANGTTITYGYDDADRIKSITYKKADGTLIGDLTYTFDKDGRITNQGGSLAALNIPTANVTSTAYNANNALTTWGSNILTYDDNGNLLSDGIYTYVWNVKNQLVQVKSGSVVVASFAYDPLGRRSRKTIGSGNTAFLYDGWNIVQEINGTASNADHSNYTANIINGPGLDERYLRILGTDGQLQSFVTDHLGSTIKLFDQNQTLLINYSYEPYGKVTPSNTVTNNPYQYTGRENDGLVGQLFYRNRYYSYNLHRFLSEDPIGFVAGQNKYSYAIANPISFVDPLGTDIMVITGGVRDGSLNLFGHVAAAVEGYGMASYGNDTDLGSSVTDYINSQSTARVQQVTIIPTTVVQDALAIEFIKKHPNKNGVGKFDNCAVRTNQILNAAGIHTNGIPFPGGTARDVQSIPGSTTYYIPQKGPIPKELLNAMQRF